MISRSSVAPALLALVALVLTACASQPRPFGLSSVADAARDACYEPIQAKACGDRTDAAACWEEVAAAYGALPDDAARKRFLVDAGCPSPTVETWLPDPR
jgi:hypothetical protein